MINSVLLQNTAKALKKIDFSKLTNNNKNMVDPMSLTPQGMALQGAGQMVGGVVKAVGSLFGGGKRRREQRRAAAELAKRKSEYEAIDTSNPYKNLTNTYENSTITGKF